MTLLFALPLYLLKIEMVPREAAWLPSLVFIAFIFPARLLTGWALARARAGGTPRHWFFRWTGRLPLLPAAAFYVLIVFFTQYTSWNGVWTCTSSTPFCCRCRSSGCERGRAMEGCRRRLPNAILYCGSWQIRRSLRQLLDGGDGDVPLAASTPPT